LHFPKTRIIPCADIDAMGVANLVINHEMLVEVAKSLNSCFCVLFGGDERILSASTQSDKAKNTKCGSHCGFRGLTILYFKLRKLNFWRHMMNDLEVSPQFGHRRNVESVQLRPRRWRKESSNILTLERDVFIFSKRHFSFAIASKINLNGIFTAAQLNI